MERGGGVEEKINVGELKLFWVGDYSLFNVMKIIV